MGGEIYPTGLGRKLMWLHEIINGAAGSWNMEKYQVG